MTGSRRKLPADSVILLAKSAPIKGRPGLALEPARGGVMRWQRTGSDEGAGSDLLRRALRFAAMKHKGQTRKGANAAPYITHPVAVARILREEAGVEDPVTLAAALLHDTVEDTETTLGELAAQFGESVADTVSWLTDPPGLLPAERKPMQAQRIGQAPISAKMVKIADKIANLRDILSSPPVGWSVEWKREYFDSAKMVTDRARDASPALGALFDEVYSRRP